MFSIYTTDGKLVSTGPDGRPYPTIRGADASALERNQRAEGYGIETRYEARPALGETAPQEAA